MKLGSLFDGSGGFPLAAKNVGITPVWASEVAPYCVAVTRQNLPEVAHLGDVSKINGAKIEPVDIVTFGSPCQDMSIAGQRDGLDGQQSRLFFEAIRIIKEMREATDGKSPRFAIWENVLGSLTSNGGNDFHRVVNELLAIGTGFPVARSEKWRHAGAICGDECSLAWRVLDARYWGVPQRRRRVFLACDFGGQSAATILFKPKDGGRSASTCGETRKDSAESAERNAGKDRSRVRAKVVYECRTIIGRYRDSGDVGPTVLANYGYGMKDVPIVVSANEAKKSIVYAPRQSVIDLYSETEEIAPTLTQSYGTGGNNQPIVLSREDAPEAIVYEVNQTDARYSDVGDVCPTLLQRLGTGGNHQPIVLQLDRDGDEEITEDDVEDYWVLNKGSFYAEPTTRMSGTLGVWEGKRQPPILATRYSARHMTSTECARLQGFPDEWGKIKAIPEDQLPFWRKVFDNWDRINGVKPKSDKQILKWMREPYRESEEYRMWGNGVALPCVEYILKNVSELDTE